ncbi:hypothetical protein D3C87_2106280 [compost metagenome]
MVSTSPACAELVFTFRFNRTMSMMMEATLPIIKLYAGERLNSRPENDDATAQPSEPHMRI